MQIDDLPFLFCVIMVITSVVSGDGSKTKEDKYMSSYKYKHLTLDDRITIQKALKDRQGSINCF